MADYRPVDIIVRNVLDHGADLHHDDASLLANEYVRSMEHLDAALVWRDKRAEEISLDLAALVEERDRLRTALNEVYSLPSQTDVTRHIIERALGAGHLPDQEAST